MEKVPWAKFGLAFSFSLSEWSELTSAQVDERLWRHKRKRRNITCAEFYDWQRFAKDCLIITTKAQLIARETVDYDGIARVHSHWDTSNQLDWCSRGTPPFSLHARLIKRNNTGDPHPGGGSVTIHSEVAVVGTFGTNAMCLATIACSVRSAPKQIKRVAVEPRKAQMQVPARKPARVVSVINHALLPAWLAAECFSLPCGCVSSVLTRLFRTLTVIQVSRQDMSRVASHSKIWSRRVDVFGNFRKHTVAESALSQAWCVIQIALFELRYSEVHTPQRKTEGFRKDSCETSDHMSITSTPRGRCSEWREAHKNDLRHSWAQHETKQALEHAQDAIHMSQLPWPTLAKSVRQLHSSSARHAWIVSDDGSNENNRSRVTWLASLNTFARPATSGLANWGLGLSAQESKHIQW